MSKNEKSCFVIMPFSKTTDEHTEDYWTRHFDNFLKPLIEELDLDANRSKPLRGDILRQIITDLVTSPVVVADLTDNNSNVYWELGVRQSFKHGTVTIAEKGTKLPFDISSKGTLTYHTKDHLKMENFRKIFKEAILDCLEHPDVSDSHVLETLSGRGSLFEIFHKDEAIRRLDAVLSECDFNAKGFKAIAKRIQDNLKNPSKRAYLTTRFRISAVELLVTNRYIDEDDSFFELAEEYMSDIVTANDQLKAWAIKPKITEEYFLKKVESWDENLKKFKDRILSAREDIVKRF